MTTDRTEYPKRIADFLERLAISIRAMTVDRIANYVTWMALGIVLFVATLLVLIWVLVGVFRALGELIGVEAAYAAVGGILLVAGVLLWRVRDRGVTKTTQE